MNAVAIHEAGHMLVAQAAGWKVTSVEVASDGGEVAFAPTTEPSIEDIKNVLAAGAAAELVTLGKIVSSCRDLYSDILLFGRWSIFQARAKLVAETLDAGAILALADSLTGGSDGYLTAV